MLETVPTVPGVLSASVQGEGRGRLELCCADGSGVARLHLDDGLWRVAVTLTPAAMMGLADALREAAALAGGVDVVV